VQEELLSSKVDEFEEAMKDMYLIFKVDDQFYGIEIKFFF